MNEENLQKIVQDLSFKVNELTKAKTDQHILDVIDKRISAIEKKAIAFILLIAAIFGIATSTTLEDKIATYLASDVMKKIDNEVERLTVGLSTQQDRVNEDLKTQIATINNKIEKGTQITDIGNKNESNKNLTDIKDKANGLHSSSSNASS